MTRIKLAVLAISFLLLLAVIGGGSIVIAKYPQGHGPQNITPSPEPPTPTFTNTPVPPTPTFTNTPVPPTATNTPLPTATNTPLPTATNTPLPTATNTPLPTATNTPVPAPPTFTNTPVPAPPTFTNTPVPPTPTFTNTPVPAPPTFTNTPVPAPPTHTPTTVPAASLDALKSSSLLTDADGNGAASPGDTLHYTISIRNTGQATLTGVTYSDTPDANTTLVNGSVTTSQGTITQGNGAGDGSISVTVGTMPAGQTITINYNVTVNDPLPAGTTELVNQGVASSNETAPVNTDDPNTATVDDPTVVQVVDPADPAAMTAWKTSSLLTDADGNGAVSPGDTLHYTITIGNVGQADLTGVTYSDTPDANTTLVNGSVTASQGTVTQGNGAGDSSIAVSLGTITPDQTVTIDYNVTINDPLPAGTTELVNQGVASSNETAPVNTDDPNTATVDDPTVVQVVDPADPAAMTAWKTSSLLADADGNGAVSPGDTLRYTINVRNLGQADLTGVTYSDTPDANTTLVNGSVATSQGTVTQGNAAGDSSITVSIGTMTPEQTVTINYNVTVNNPLPAGTTQIVNEGVATSNETAPVNTDDPNTATVGDATIVDVAPPTTPEDPAPEPASDPAPTATATAAPAAPTATAVPGEPPAPELSIDKAASQSQVEVGDRIEFTITVRNVGSVPAENVTVTDDLPRALRFEEASTTHGTVFTQGRTVTVRIGTLQPGAVATITVVTTVTEEATPGERFNSASVTADGLHGSHNSDDGSEGGNTHNTSARSNFTVLDEDGELGPSSLPSTGAKAYRVQILEGPTGPLLGIMMFNLLVIGFLFRKRMRATKRRTHVYEEYDYGE